MSVNKYTCPECKAVLKPAKPLTPGKKVRCPKCEAIFTVEGEDGTTPRKPAPPAPRPLEDDEAGTYGVIDHEKSDAEDEIKENIHEISLRDKFPKSKRMSVQSIVIPPSNLLLGTGILMALGALLCIIWWLFPIMFTEHFAEPRQVLRDPKGRPWDLNWEDFKLRRSVEKDPARKQDLEDAYNKLLEIDRSEKWSRAVLIFFIGLPLAVYSVLIIMAAVKMQNLESYPWAMAGSILAMPSLLGFPGGMWCYVTLRKPDVKLAFEEEPE